MRLIVTASLAALTWTSLSCTKAPATAPTTPATTTTTTTPAATKHAVDFIEDDLDAAVARARVGTDNAKKKLVFVDAWAPWCHTCLSMQREVLSKPALSRFADRVVFVAIDTDREKNAAFVAAHPLRVWPTFFVLDPANPLGPPVAVRPGSMSLDETLAFVEDALSRSSADASADAGADIGADIRAAARAHSALATGDKAAAIAAFDDAIAAAVGDDAAMRRREYIVQSAWTRVGGDDPAACLAFIDAHRDTLKKTTSPGGVLFDIEGAALSCASKLGDVAAKTAAVQASSARLQALIASPPAGAAVDDIADGMATLADVIDEGGDHAAAVALHEKRLALLEADAKTASSEKGAQVHDYARMNSLLFLGRSDDAVALLSARAKALPDDYEPPARLASALFRAKRFDEARAAANDAIRLSYGPRRLRYLSLLADIEKGAGNSNAEQAALRRVVDDGNALPPAMRLQSVIDAASKRLPP